MGLYRRIVYKHCDRWTRRQTPPTLAFDEAGYEGPSAPSPADDLGSRETRDRLLAALDTLSERQRSVLVLHDMGGHSLAELSSFLGVPASTVKKRLHDAGFARGVVEILEAARHGDTERVKALLLRNPGLRHGRDFMGNTAVILTVACGHLELAALLLEAGAPIDIHEGRRSTQPVAHEALDLRLVPHSLELAPPPEGPQEIFGDLQADQPARRPGALVEQAECLQEFEHLLRLHRPAPREIIVGKELNGAVPGPGHGNLFSALMSS